MKKTLYIARVSDGNSDSYRAYFTSAEAMGTAQEYAAHLTSAEKASHTVSLETYNVIVSDDDQRTAEALYNALMLEEDDVIGNSSNADAWQEITWPAK